MKKIDRCCGFDIFVSPPIFNSSKLGLLFNLKEMAIMISIDFKFAAA